MQQTRKPYIYAERLFMSALFGFKVEILILTIPLGKETYFEILTIPLGKETGLVLN